MFGFKKHCKICGIELERPNEFKRFGKSFCSEEHATQFADIKKQQLKDNSTNRRGSCC